jgi:alpha-D-ribose 1-methylphosphonate 5-triphosphate synthase subunit PhnI
MGYTMVKGLDGAVAAAAALVESESQAVAARDAVGWITASMPLLVEQICAESGVFEPRAAARAIVQARGDLARAVSLVRAWSAGLPRLGAQRVGLDDLRTSRRITPAFVEPEGGQYLGPSLDYAPRLLDLGADEIHGDQLQADAVGGDASPADDGLPRGGLPPSFPRALAPLAEEGLLREPDSLAEVEDITRLGDPMGGRGAFQQTLCRGETGALTALAYSAQRGYGTRQDPTISELRQGHLPVHVTDPRSGRSVRIGVLPATFVEIVFYRIHDGEPDARFTIGVGATLGRIERRAIAAAVLDASCARAAGDPDALKAPSDEQEFLTIVLDGQEASGFVEHLKLPHHVSFTSDLDRLREAGRRALEEDET